MHLHEYQSKHLLKKYNIPVPLGEVVSNPEAAVDVANKLVVIVGWLKPKYTQVVVEKQAVSV